MSGWCGEGDGSGVAVYSAELHGEVVWSEVAFFEGDELDVWEVLLEDGEGDAVIGATIAKDDDSDFGVKSGLKGLEEGLQEGVEGGYFLGVGVDGAGCGGFEEELVACAEVDFVEVDGGFEGVYVVGEVGEEWADGPLEKQERVELCEVAELHGSSLCFWSWRVGIVGVF